MDVCLKSSLTTKAVDQTLFKRNAKALPPNAIVDVRRRRRHEMIVLVYLGNN